MEEFWRYAGGNVTAKQLLLKVASTRPTDFHPDKDITILKRRSDGTPKIVQGKDYRVFDLKRKDSDGTYIYAKRNFPFRRDVSFFLLDVWMTIAAVVLGFMLAVLVGNIIPDDQLQQRGWMAWIPLVLGLGGAVVSIVFWVIRRNKFKKEPKIVVDYKRSSMHSAAQHNISEVTANVFKRVFNMQRVLRWIFATCLIFFLVWLGILF
jgi:hypothetical protein